MSDNPIFSKRVRDALKGRRPRTATPEEAMRCPEVQALVEALEGLIQMLDTEHDNGEPVKRSSRVVVGKAKARAALADLPAAETKQST